ncbi:MAG: nitroreductase family protein [Candidatus Daviesbacteria bacterium]
MLDEIVKRRSIRKYKSDTPSDEDITEIIKAAQFAPSGRNTKPWEFYVVKSKETREKLAQSLGQGFIAEAPVLIVPCADPEKSNLLIQDLSATSENIFLQATNLGLGTVWKNVPEEKMDEVKEIIGIPENFIVINLIPVGYPAEGLPAHSEADFDPEKIHWEK